MSRLNDIGAKTLEETYQALPNRDLQPDEDLKQMAKVASTNGQVDARIATVSQGVVEVSTAGKPLLKKVEVNPDIQTEQQTFEQSANDLADTIDQDQMQP